jgi:hypothetical protein
MSDIPKKFSLIEVTATVKNGRRVHYSHSSPRGIDISEYNRIVDAAFKAYGNKGTRVVGTPFPG